MELTFPPEYCTLATSAELDNDTQRIAQLSAKGDLDLDFVQLQAPTDVQLRLYYRGEPITLSRLLPILHNLGFEVVDERPYVIGADGSGDVHLSVIGMRSPNASALALDECERRTVETFRRVWMGDAEDDTLNRLVLNVGMTWREVALTRAYYRYLRQIGSRYELGFIAAALERHRELTLAITALFHARFDPDRADPDRADELRASLPALLQAVPSLEHDYILRTAAAAVEATVRTNFYQPDRSTISFKLDPARVPGMPLPRPLHEIFVYSPRVEGVHLRAGDIARGGIRYSDRVDDYRTEILQLMKAQVAKNAIIVPTGAKGGFICRRPAGRDEVVACYETFIAGLLDLTDNRVAGSVVAPARTVRHDQDDPYLVVAADKGTARFSDNANRLSIERGFWLGDAFASGGSAGYDHKEMGITAKGAWCSIRRHFDELDISLDTPFSVVGIGDMSGDVFGNGMLEERNVKLVAAFDHRHIFIDPDPDTEVSYQERLRLFGLPQSSWADYDHTKLSPGGGVYARDAKSIELSPPARAVLATDASTLTPNEVVKAILSAPVDLLYNGGIGTFVKARTESHLEVGDKSSDAIRVDAQQVRARVIGEGGNLGLTARARVEYCLRGGRVFADAVDNSAGVNTSDHEVNIKILLSTVHEPLDDSARTALLERMRDEVAEHVLASNRSLSLALTNSRLEAASMLNVHADQMRWLERVAHLDRAVEALPDDAEIGRRHDQGLGLTPPEVAVLMAYTTNALADELLEDDLLAYPYFQRMLASYFPHELRDHLPAAIQAHPLRQQLIATLAANQLMHRAGLSMAYRIIDETGASTADLARAHAVAWELFQMSECWREIDGQAAVAADVRSRLRIDGRRLVERASRWLLRIRRLPFAVDETIGALGPPLARLMSQWPQLVSSDVAATLSAAAEDYERLGVAHSVAHRAARQQTFIAALDVIDVATRAEVDVVRAGSVFFRVSDALHLHPIAQRIDALPRDDRWQTLARLALREDHQRTHAELTELALHGDDDFAAAWTERQPRLMRRWLEIANAIGTAAASSEQLSVAVRELRTLHQQLNGG